MIPSPSRTLADLERRLAYDLACLNEPPGSWPRTLDGPDGFPMLDALVVGGGMCGLVAAAALRRRGLTRLRIVDRSAEGTEGPWVTYARMRTLRSPKHLAGPALGLPALTFRAWFEAQWGERAWEALDRIPRTQWMDYLRWYRRVLDLPVENRVSAIAVEPVPGGLAIRLKGPVRRETVHTRRLILATGREGIAVPRRPAWSETLPTERVWHTSEPVDFPAMAGRAVAVIGYGASAFDNAAEALEAGAASVVLLARQPEMPRVNKFKGIVFPGFTLGYPTLAPADRWRMMTYLFDAKIAPPRAAVLRVCDDPRFAAATSADVTAADWHDDRIVLRSTAGRFEVDHLILGTGFKIDLAGSPLLAPVADRIATWRRLVTPPPHQADHEFLDFPDLGPGFELQPRVEGDLPWLRRIHAFTFAAALSHGSVSGDIPAVSDGANRLADSVAAAEFREELSHHEQVLRTFDDPELSIEDVARLRPPPASISDVAD
ncbi:NAD(P)/FAD-dependent oxidoreductase [Thalassobaculum sp.]|uniref:NAD(P)/FAD-dependent oxidoreductase n=1 Tax=Thalassobaculum sp. TaxID=2022740 RepID=UPI0032EACE7C